MNPYKEIKELKYRLSILEIQIKDVQDIFSTMNNSLINSQYTSHPCGMCGNDIRQVNNCVITDCPHGLNPND